MQPGGFDVVASGDPASQFIAQRDEPIAKRGGHEPFPAYARSCGLVRGAVAMSAIPVMRSDVGEPVAQVGELTTKMPGHLGLARGIAGPLTRLTAYVDDLDAWHQATPLATRTP